MLVDSHCHLDQLEDAGTALAEAAARGVRRVVAVSESASSMAQVLALGERHPEQVLTGLGLHPAWVAGAADEEVEAGLAWLEEHLPQADVLGEVGLDHRWATDAAAQQRQEAVLERQLALAAACRKPINLHSRRAQRQTMERAIAHCRRTGLSAQLHWFTHSRKLVRICNEEGLFVSVGPTVIDSAQTQEVAMAIADDLLLLETDAPVPVGGVEGRPARVRQVAEKLAALKGCTWEEIARRTAANFSRYLDRPLT